MSGYPLMDRIDSEGWDETPDVGVEHMRAADGSHKSHITHNMIGYSFRFTHSLITLEESNSLMDFWSRNYMHDFAFTSPLDGREALVRFKVRPRIVERRGAWLSVQVELIGRYV